MVLLFCAGVNIEHVKAVNPILDTIPEQYLDAGWTLNIPQTDNQSKQASLSRESKKYLQVRSNPFLLVILDRFGDVAESTERLWFVAVGGCEGEGAHTRGAGEK